MLKNRIDLAVYLAEQGLNKGAEIGVFGGYFSEVLFLHNPNLELLCVDIWGYGKYKNAEEEARARLKPYNATIVKGLSEEVAETVPDESLDFVYLDGAHDYDNIKADINAWTPKVRIGGIVAMDDFYDFPSGKGGVMRAATEYTSHHQYNLKITDWDIDNPIRDNRQPNAWFVRTHANGTQHPHERKAFDGFKNI